jgi:hypothetical protein
MKFIAFALLCASPSFAAEKFVSITTEVKVDGKVVSAARTLNFPAGGSGEFTQELPGSGLLKVSLSAAPQKANAVKLDYDVAYSSGQKSIKAKPSLVVKLGEGASIGVGFKGKEELTLNVMAKEGVNPAEVVDKFTPDELDAYAKMPMSDEDYLETLEMAEPPPASKN